MPEQTDRIHLQYNLVFESPSHCGSGLPRLLLDRAVRRNANGELFVPGATVKGVVRERCEQLATLFGLEARSPHDEDAAKAEYEAPDLLARIFGSRRRPGELYFDDLKLSPDSKQFFRSGGKLDYRLQTFERTQVSLSRQTGTAKPQHLFSSEFGIGDLAFEGEISGYLSDLPMNAASQITYATVLLIAGLLALDRIGGNKSTGAGKCRVEITNLKLNGQPSDPAQLMESLSELEYADYAWGEEA